jgi:hypothetical protein
MVFYRVHIHFCDNGHLWFRSYSGSLGKAPSNQGLLPLAFGPSLRLGVPSLRSCSVGPPRWALLGPARLNRHPCRFTHCAEPPLGLSMGQENQKPNQQRGGLKADLIGSRTHSPCRSQRCGDPTCRRTRRCGVPVVPRYRSSPASLAPTGDWGYLQKSGRLSGRLAFVFDLGRPVNHDGRTQALRSGETGRTPV